MDWREQHNQVIQELLSFINNQTKKYILKGGTALKQCYGLDRHSDDIDLDGKGNLILELCQKFSEEKGYSFRIAKDTETVKRCMIHYGGEKPLKVETSSRRNHIPEEEVTNINGIQTYTINTLSILKSNAYSGRDKIRDLYDITFIINNYYEKLSTTEQSVLRNALEYKGLEQFDYIVSTQKDEQIDIDKLAENFLNAYEKIGLVASESEKESVMESVLEVNSQIEDYETF